MTEVPKKRDDDKEGKKGYRERPLRQPPDRGWNPPPPPPTAPSPSEKPDPGKKD